MRTLTAAAMVVIQHLFGTFLGDAFATSDLPALHFIDAPFAPTSPVGLDPQACISDSDRRDGMLPASSYAAR